MSDTLPIYNFIAGNAPVLVSVPHAGLQVPDEIARRMTAAAHRLFDTDWYVDQLYSLAPSIGAGLLTATHSRYVIDLNRPPDGSVLYPGADNTELCPMMTFRSEPIYLDGLATSRAETMVRLARYWVPYHKQLAAELDRLHRRFGCAVLLDGHSIRSQVPRFFPDRLPHINWGTNDGTTASNELLSLLLDASREFLQYEVVANQRFKGGYTTRHFGRPSKNIHAVQLEITWNTYITDEDAPEDRRHFHPEQINRLLRRVIQQACEWAHTHTRRYARAVGDEQ